MKSTTYMILMEFILTILDTVAQNATLIIASQPWIVGYIILNEIKGWK